MGPKVNSQVLKISIGFGLWFVLSAEKQPIEGLIELSLAHLAHVSGVIRNDFTLYERYGEHFPKDPMIAVIDTHSFSM